MKNRSRGVAGGEEAGAEGAGAGEGELEQKEPEGGEA